MINNPPNIPISTVPITISKHPEFRVLKKSPSLLPLTSIMVFSLFMVTFGYSVTLGNSVTFGYHTTSNRVSLTSILLCQIFISVSCSLSIEGGSFRWYRPSVFQQFLPTLFLEGLYCYFWLHLLPFVTNDIWDFTFLASGSGTEIDFSH